MLLRAILLTLCLLLPQAVSAQAIDYAAWGKVAQRATLFLEERSGSDADLARLREDISKYRASFTEAQNANAAQITALKEQIAALGPAPEGDEVETREVAARRKQLKDDLAKAQEPVLKAVEAQAQAEAMVKSLADLERERKARRIFHLSSTPLSPSGWAAALAETRNATVDLAREIGGRVSTLGMQDLQGWARQGIIALLSGLVLALWGWWIVRKVSARSLAKLPERFRGPADFLISTAQVALPMLGLQMMLGGLMAMGLFGPLWIPLMGSLLQAACVAVIGFWLVDRLFDPDRPALPFSSRARRRGRICGFAMVVAFALSRFLSESFLPLKGVDIAIFREFAVVPRQLSEAAAGVIYLPVIMLGALALHRFERVMELPAGKASDDCEKQIPYRARIMSLVAAIGKRVAQASVLLALIGYVSLANTILWSSILSMGLIVAILLAQDFLSDLFGVFSGKGKSSHDGLAPIMVGLILTVASLPLFAITWGMQPADLSETMVELRKGVSLGDVSLSPGAILTFLLTLAGGVMATRAIKSAFRTTVLPRTKLDQGAQNAAVSGIGYAGISIAVIVAVMSAGIDLSSLAIVAGALSVGIGFGLQNIISNFVSGIILLIERPIGVGDWIDAGGQQGYVRSISVRSTRIQTFDRNEVIVPNSDLISRSVTNWTRGNTVGRVIIPVTVAFGTDTRKVERILLEIGQEHPEVVVFPEPVAFFAGFAPNGYMFELRVILSDIREFVRVSTQLRHAIVDRFREEGVSIPLTIQEVRLMPAPEPVLHGPSPVLSSGHSA